MTKFASRLPYIHCPHCGVRAFARRAGKTTEMYRELYYHCHDALHCGHVFVVAMQILRTVRPASYPNPAVNLPLSAFTRPANDTDGPANDDAPPPRPPAAKLKIE